jgi:hypothetical protein
MNYAVKKKTILKSIQENKKHEKKANLMEKKNISPL